MRFGRCGRSRVGAGMHPAPVYPRDDRHAYHRRDGDGDGGATGDSDAPVGEPRRPWLVGRHLVALNKVIAAIGDRTNGDAEGDRRGPTIPFGGRLSFDDDRELDVAELGEHRVVVLNRLDPDRVGARAPGGQVQLERV